MGVLGGFAEEMDDFLKVQELRPKSTSMANRLATDGHVIVCIDASRT